MGLAKDKQRSLQLEARCMQDGERIRTVPQHVELEMLGQWENGGRVWSVVW